MREVVEMSGAGPVLQCRTPAGSRGGPGEFPDPPWSQSPPDLPAANMYPHNADQADLVIAKINILIILMSIIVCVLICLILISLSM